MTTSSLARRSLRVLARLTLPLSLFAALGATAQTLNLADKPLFSTTNVPGNLLLDLSVEYPTANTSAYFSTSTYSSSTVYLGYFDGLKCYTYTYNSTTPSLSYFQPDSLATSQTCTSTSTKPLWSGNWLNYASMQGLDIFRWVLTGGNRTVDNSGTNGQTILTRSTHSGQGGSGDAPNKVLAAANEPGATPFNWTTKNNTRVWGAGISMWITGNTTDITGNPTLANYKAQQCNSTTCNSGTDTDSDGNVYSTVVYRLYMNVRVCDSSVGVETNCVLYGNTYKPEGLMQQYSQTLRYGAFGYLNDSNVNRDAGVLRARMAYIGPTQPVPGSAATTNANPEWNGTTGIMLPNPDPTDATDSNTYTQGFASTSAGVTQSGVMNYLNKFGYAAAAVDLGSAYKTYDPVSELYYASVRYLKGQSNVTAYTDMTGAGASTVNTWVDGFPVITKWTDVSSTYDPIVYACQKNFILGIGDVNTHHDGNLPGSSLTGGEPSMPPEVSADTTINVTTATNAVGTMEGTTSTLGSTNFGDSATYYIAGMAYDAHIPLDGHGVRKFTDSTKTPPYTISTVSTYWLDVLEYQTYVTNNQYYYATKYGGFTVPGIKNPTEAYTYGTAPTLTSWYTSTNTQGGNDQPDNYFTAANATLMQAGLTSAFAKIAAENTRAFGTALAVPTPNVAQSGAVSYATDYDPQTWTGQVIGSTVTFDSTGTPTLTAQWDARALLSATTVTDTTRQIVTCCTTSTTSPGLPFTYTSLSTATLNARTNYTSFSSVPNASCTASTAQCITNYIAYLRGNTAQEIANGGAYRTRTFRLGDIVNSKPVIVGPPAFQFFDTTNPGYSAFKARYATRPNVVFAGANDGMVHAFDGTMTNSTSGSELFAYIPSFTYGTSATAATTGLASLGNPSFTHHYLVDAPAGQFDVDFGDAGVAPASRSAVDWHTILIGGLGKGGKGFYALDVTDPTTWTNESNVASKVLWEFTDSRLGYTYGTPSVVKTRKYGWVVVFTSGYNNADGIGYVFFVNPKTGALLEVVSTPSSGPGITLPLNMGEQAAYIPDYTDQTADAIYAGDVQGNVWRVDVSASDITLAYPTATQFAAFGSTQPITTRPLIEIAQNSNVRYVLVGTGKLLADSDTTTGNQQSFYAMIDGLQPFGAFYGGSTPLPTGVTFPLTRAKLNANVNPTTTGITSSPTSVMGWYIDLPVTTTTPTIAQRVNVDPFADQGYVAFIGNTPNGSACNPSGTGVVYTFNFATGQSLLQNADGTIATSVPLAGLGTDVAILGSGGTLHVYTGDNQGNAFKAPATLSSAAGVVQINWRDVPSTN